MNVFIPRPVTRLINNEVYYSIKNQTGFELHIIEVIAGVEKQEGVSHRVRSRNLILSIARGLYEPFFVSLDSDTALIGNTVLFEMFDKICSDQHIGAVSATNKKLYSLNGHIDLACTMIRTKAIENIQFRQPEGSGCECNSFGIDLAKKGYKHIYLDNEIRIKTVPEVRNEWEGILKRFVWRKT